MTFNTIVCCALLLALGSAGCSVNRDVDGSLVNSPLADDRLAASDVYSADLGRGDASLVESLAGDAPANSGDDSEDLDAEDAGGAVDVLEAAEGPDVWVSGDTFGAWDAEETVDVLDAWDAEETVDVLDVWDAEETVDVLDAADVFDVGDTVDAEDALVSDADEVDAEHVTDATETDVASDAAADPAPAGTRAPEFSLVHAGALSNHEVATEGVPRNGFGYGYGMTPLDADGDGDLDVFVGTLPGSQQAACIYENVSTPDAVRYARREPWCAPLDAELQAAVALDPDGDGVHEMVAVSEVAAYVFHAPLGWMTEQRLDAFEQCPGGPLVAVDQDWDGRLEVVVGCLPDLRGRTGIRAGTGFSLSLDPVTWLVSYADPGVFPLQENALGLGLVDANQDGLLDLVSVVDAFGSPSRFNPNVEPSALLRRCAPGAGCGSERVRFGEGPLAWGSHMGFEVSTMRDGHDVYWLGDRDAPRPVVYGDEFFTPASLTLPPEPFGDEFGYFDIWSIVVGEWNADAAPDFFLSVGDATPRAVGPDVRHQLSVLTGEWTEGTLHTTQADTRAQFPSPNDFRDPIHRTPRASRAALQQDADGDGRAELIVAAANGAPHVHVALNGSPVCMVRPTPTTAMTWGAGYRTLRGDGVWAVGPVHGELLSNDGPWFLTSERRGALRFPSGAAVGYDCADSNMVDVVEPDWLGVSLAEGAISVTIDERFWWNGLPTTVRAWVESGGVGVEIELSRRDASWRSAIISPEVDARVLLQIDGQWVARWFPVSPF